MFSYRPKFTWMWPASCYLLAALCVLAACVPATPQMSEPAAYPETMAHYAAADCRFPMPDWPAITCGDLDVPEDYSKPGGRRIRLHVAVVGSSSETPAADPLVVLYGGPGAYTLDRIDKTIERFAGVLATRDLILFDQRGVGYSEPSLNCPEIDGLEVSVIDAQMDKAQGFERRLAAYQGCRQRLEASGVDLHQYTADALTADLVGLRRALGYTEWNVYGVSYGARQALLLMRDDAQGLRSVVLDSVYPVDIDLARETAVTYAYALDTLFESNAAAHPQFEQTFFDLVQTLDRSPVNVPALIPKRWVYPYRPFDGDDFLRLILRIVGLWPGSFPHLPEFSADIAGGNYADLMELIRPSTGDQLFSEGMNLAVVCQEISGAPQTAIDERGLPISPRLIRFAQDDVTQRLALCALWLGEDVERRPQAVSTSQVPALVLRGERDVIVPASWDARVVQSLPNSFYLSFAQAGHGVVTNNACARDALAAFLLDPASAPESTCRE